MHGWIIYDILVFISNVLDISVVVLTMQKGPFPEVLIQYSEKLEGQLLKILFYICLNLSVYLVCYMHPKHAQLIVRMLSRLSLQ